MRRVPDLSFIVTGALTVDLAIHLLWRRTSCHSVLVTPPGDSTMAMLPWGAATPCNPRSSVLCLWPWWDWEVIGPDRDATAARGPLPLMCPPACSTGTRTHRDGQRDVSTLRGGHRAMEAAPSPSPAALTSLALGPCRCLHTKWCDNVE